MKQNTFLMKTDFLENLIYDGFENWHGWLQEPEWYRKMSWHRLYLHYRASIGKK